MKFQLDKFLIVSGFIGPAIFFLLMYFLLPLMYPGYSVENQTISELGDVKSPVQILANVFGFSLFGIFIMLFTAGLFRMKEINFIGKIASVLIFITGILMYLVGVFYGGPGGGFTQLANLHNMAANYQFPVLAAGYIIFGISVLQDKKLRWLIVPILLLGGLSLYFANIFFIAGELASRGIIQRVMIGLPYLLMTIIAVTIYKFKQ